MSTADLSIAIAKLKLNNPLMNASGCFAFGEEYRELWDNSRDLPGNPDITQLGALITKAISLATRPGNPHPRIVETPCGMINSIGLQNPGFDVFISDVLPQMSAWKIPIIANVVGFTVAEFGEICARVENETDANQIPALELDLSCPNVEVGGASFANDLSMMTDAISCARKNTSRTLIAKLSPNVCDIIAFAQAAINAGADALTLCNTYIGMAIDVYTKHSRISRPTGGLSGPAIKPLTLHKVYLVHKAFPDVPIIASGGIANYLDALEYLIAGATGLQLGTGLWYDPLLPFKILNGLNEYLIKFQLNSILEVIGTFQEW